MHDGEKPLQVKNAILCVGVCVCCDGNDEKKNLWPDSPYDANVMKLESNSIRTGEESEQITERADGQKQQLMRKTSFFFFCSSSGGALPQIPSETLGQNASRCEALITCFPLNKMLKMLYYMFIC